jgi:hypothetical protein
MILMKGSTQKGTQKKIAKGNQKKEKLSEK